MKTKKAKKSVAVVPQPVWQVVDRRDIKYDQYLLSELISRIMSSVPPGTEQEDIRIEFEVDDTRGYYDDIIISAEMIISVRKK
jgi:hypothetical protein